MYSILNVIVGVPITKELDVFVHELENHPEVERSLGLNWAEWEDLGFEDFYHGAAEGAQGYCGVLLGEWELIGDVVRYSSKWNAFYITGENGKEQAISLAPSQEQLDEAHKLVDSLHPEIRKRCPEFGVYFVESTS